MKGIKNTQAVLTTEDWREAFKKATKRFPDRKVLFRELATVDDFYGTAEGKSELDNVRYDKAGLKKTARATLTLEKWLNNQAEAKISKRLKRQKLVMPDEK